MSRLDFITNDPEHKIKKLNEENKKLKDEVVIKDNALASLKQEIMMLTMRIANLEAMRGISQPNVTPWQQPLVGGGWSDSGGTYYNYRSNTTNTPWAYFTLGSVTAASSSIMTSSSSTYWNASGNISYTSGTPNFINNGGHKHQLCNQ